MDRLSLCECKVLSLLTEGHSNREIARRINRSEATIKMHLKNIYRKLGVTNRVQAVRFIFELVWTANTTVELTDALELIIWRHD